MKYLVIYSLCDEHDDIGREKEGCDNVVAAVGEPYNTINNGDGVLRHRRLEVLGGVSLGKSTVTFCRLISHIPISNSGSNLRYNTQKQVNK